MDCALYSLREDPYLSIDGGGGGGGFSHKSELDLAAMVNDFLETESTAVDSNGSSDNEGLSQLCDLHHLSNKILFYRNKIEPYGSDLSSIVRSFIFSINKADLELVKSGSPCNNSCIRFTLVKLLRSSGYDAAVCSSKWLKDKIRNIPGGDHEYIDVNVHSNSGIVKRIIIDIDFRSHFEIARAVDSYSRILDSLPFTFVGSLYKLKQYLKVMVEAVKYSLNQNSMPLPPWRSRAYLQAKWNSTYKRMIKPDDQTTCATKYDHQQCVVLLESFKSSLQSETQVTRLLKPIHNNDNGRLKLERLKYSSFISRAP